jgi:cohesin complex subunit SA-1/2
MITFLVPCMERFKEQLLALAITESDMMTQIAAINVVTLLGKQDIWEEHVHRCVLMTRLLLHGQPRIRKAIAPFGAQLFRQEVFEPMLLDARQEAEYAGQEDTLNEIRIAFKAFANFIDEYLVKPSQYEQEDRIQLATETLWSHLPALHEWQTLIDLLVLDHSDPTSTSRSRRRSKARHDDTLPTYYRLNPAQESILLQVLVTVIRLLISADKNKTTEVSVMVDMVYGLLISLLVIY